MIRNDVMRLASGETQLQCNAGLPLLKNIFIQADKSILRLMPYSTHVRKTVTWDQTGAGSFSLSSSRLNDEGGGDIIKRSRYSSVMEVVNIGIVPGCYIEAFFSFIP